MRFAHAFGLAALLTGLPLSAAPAAKKSRANRPRPPVSAATSPGVRPSVGPGPRIELSERTRAALSDSDAGLEEAPAVGGGVIVDLKGRFRSATIATVGPDGSVSVRCISHLPPESGPPKVPGP